MAKFLTQIVLHKAGASAIYNQLDEAMQEMGFTRKLPGKKAAYLLPTGAYWHEGRVSTNEIRFMATRAAQTTGQDFGVVVVRANGWSVTGLKRTVATAKG